MWTYSKNNDGTATITGYDKNATKTPTGEVTIPKVYKGYTITKVGSSALNGNKDITRVVIPDTVISIGSQAFYNCTNLTSVSFPSSLKNIDGSAFAKTKVQFTRDYTG